MDIQQTIKRAHYVATEAQVETLAAAHWNVAIQLEGSNSTYLRVVLVGAQAELGKKRGRQPSAQSQLAVLEKVHERFYAAVLRGVTTPDIAKEEGLEATESSRRALERNRRSTFARSSKTALANYAKAGGDLRGLVPDEVTKASLRAAIEPPPPEDRTARQLAAAQGSILRAVARRARGDPDGARGMLEAVVTKLQAALEAMDQGAPMEEAQAATTVVAQGRRQSDRGPARTRVGVPLLNRGAP